MFTHKKKCPARPSLRVITHDAREYLAGDSARQSPGSVPSNVQSRQFSMHLRLMTFDNIKIFLPLSFTVAPDTRQHGAAPDKGTLDSQAVEHKYEDGKDDPMAIADLNKNVEKPRKYSLSETMQDFVKSIVEGMTWGLVNFMTSARITNSCRGFTEVLLDDIHRKLLPRGLKLYNFRIEVHLDSSQRIRCDSSDRRCKCGLSVWSTNDNRGEKQQTDVLQDKSKATWNKVYRQIVEQALLNHEDEYIKVPEGTKPFQCKSPLQSTKHLDSDICSTVAWELTIGKTLTGDEALLLKQGGHITDKQFLEFCIREYLVSRWIAEQRNRKDRWFQQLEDLPRMRSLLSESPEALQTSTMGCGTKAKGDFYAKTSRGAAFQESQAVHNNVLSHISPKQQSSILSLERFVRNVLHTLKSNVNVPGASLAVILSSLLGSASASSATNSGPHSINLTSLLDSIDIDPASIKPTLAGEHSHTSFKEYFENLISEFSSIQAGPMISHTAWALILAGCYLIIRRRSRNGERPASLAATMLVSAVATVFAGYKYRQTPESSASYESEMTDTALLTAMIFNWALTALYSKSTLDKYPKLGRLHAVCIIVAGTACAYASAAFGLWLLDDIGGRYSNKTALFLTLVVPWTGFISFMYLAVLADTPLGKNLDEGKYTQGLLGILRCTAQRLPFTVLTVSTTNISIDLESGRGQAVKSSRRSGKSKRSRTTAIDTTRY